MYVETGTNGKVLEVGGRRSNYDDSTRFPTDYFCHAEIVGNLPQTIGGTSTLLREIWRSLKFGAELIIDKRLATDHPYFIRLLDDTKLVVKSSSEKLVLEKAFETRPKMLLPPGLGDSYWSIVKLESFIAINHLNIPEITLVSEPSKNNGHLRALGFIEMFPFVHANTGIVINDQRLKSIWHEAYAIPARTLFTKVAGHDYFLSYNGNLRVGKELENIDKQLTCNWHPHMFVSLEQEQFRQSMERQHGPYFVCYFPFYGTYRFWANDFNDVAVAQTINLISKTLQMRPIFAGAKWDRADIPTTRSIGQVKDVVNLMGQTDVQQLFGLLKGAEFVIGYPSGLTILAAVLGTKTLIIWNEYYDKNFAMFCAPPDVRNKTYFIDWTHKLTKERLAAEAVDLAKDGFVDPQKYPVQIPDSLFRQRIPTPKRPSGRAVPQRVVATVSQLRDYKPVSITVTVIPDKVTATVLCVLKSGSPDYTADYVVKLRNMLHRNTTVMPRFICLTDMKIPPGVCEVVDLKYNLPGWWSKLELFRDDLSYIEHKVYFDLDTLIINNIDDVLRLDVGFAALGAWNPGPDRANPSNFGSGMMLWNGENDLSFLLDNFDINNIPTDPLHRWNKGDQYYIVDSLDAKKVMRCALQDATPGIYSYKRNCSPNLPADARIVCFHGKPRPHQALGVKWVRNAWR